MDLRLNENKIRSVHYSSLSRFGNLTYLNLTKNDISYVEDGAFSAQFNLQVSSDGQDASVLESEGHEQMSSRRCSEKNSHKCLFYQRTVIKAGMFFALLLK